MKRPLVVLLIMGLMGVVGCSKQPASPPAAAGTGAAPAAAPAAPTTPPTTTSPAVVPAAAVSAEGVADFPEYPGSTRVAVGQRTEAEHGFTRKSEASWTSTDPFVTVVAFYQKAIGERGWTVTSTESKATEMEWRLTKGTSVAKVEIKQAANVIIQIERSDR